jgi:hypothetical protein
MSINSDFNNVEKNIRKEMESNRKALLNSLTKDAAAILNKSKPLTPYLTGELRNSGAVVVRGNEIEITYTAKHALTVHEDLAVPHDSGQAKFLEYPFVELAREIVSRLNGGEA